MTVKLRQRKQRTGKISLYLEYYQGYSKDEAGKIKTNKKYEYLKLYLTDKPKTTRERQTNKETLQLAESIRAKRQIEIQNGTYGFRDKFKENSAFLPWFKQQVDERFQRTAKSNGDNWWGTYRYLKQYFDEGTKFADIDEDAVEGFKQYLLKDARKSNGQPLAHNSCFSYFNKFKAGLRIAFEKRIIADNPGKRVKGVKQPETKREYLTLDELQAVAQAECDIPALKQAFLFSALTGLRWSDINKLKWSEVQHSNEEGWYIRFQQKKTGGQETQPISEQARELLGEIGELDERVFSGLRYSSWYNVKLSQWMLRAGVTKSITFHCARHTYATLQLSLGTDIYTVSKLLGHRELRTTQVYAKIVDEQKREAANRINIDL